MLDQQVEEVNVRPVPGHLFQVAGTATTATMLMPITVTLVSDMGAESVAADSHGHFQFNPQAPGKFELNVSSGPLWRIYAVSNSTATRPICTSAPSDCRAYSSVLRTTREAASIPRRFKYWLAANCFPVPVRRKPCISKTDAPPSPRADGRFALAPNPAYYAAGFTVSGRPSTGRVDGWNDASYITGPNYTSASIKFTLSASPGSIHGAVNYASQSVEGVPVFLEPYDLDPAQRVAAVRMTRTDTHGQYRSPASLRASTAFWAPSNTSPRIPPNSRPPAPFW